MRLTEPVLTKRIPGCVPGISDGGTAARATVSFEQYKATGGYASLAKALEMEPAKVIELVKEAVVRGRGGAGFPAGLKWSFLPQDDGAGHRYLCINCDEAEPGTFKDRLLCDFDPHLILEGIAIACHACKLDTAYFFIRGEYHHQAKVMEKAIQEAYAGGIFGKGGLMRRPGALSVDCFLHRSAGAYICGEETGLIESLEGKRAYPRIKPPYFPAALGLYMCPTIVNNVESLCHVKHIVRMSGEEYAKLGVKNNTGTRILCVSGDVKKPGYFEVEVGKVTMREVLYDMCGGPKDGREFKAVIPGGSSSKILRCEEEFTLKGKGPEGSDLKLSFWDIPMDFDSLAACGTMAGSGGVIVLDDSRKISWVLNNINTFYAHESCGQCTPCREGSMWMKKISDRIVAGEASPKDIATLESVAYQIDGRTICAFGEASSWPVEAIIAKFREELIADTKPENDDEPHNPEAEAQRRFLQPA